MTQRSDYRPRWAGIEKYEVPKESGRSPAFSMIPRIRLLASFETSSPRKACPECSIEYWNAGRIGEVREDDGVFIRESPR
jgi:hypothetical protein